MAALEEEKVKKGSNELTRGERYAARLAAKAAQKAAERGKTPLVINRLADKANQTRDWIKERRKPLLVTLVVGVLLAAGLVAWWVYAAKSEQEAGKLLASAVATSQAIILTEENALDQESVGETYSSIDERATQSLQAFRKVSKKYANTEAALFGKLGEANAYFELGKFDEARKAYERAFELAGGNNFVKWRALEGVGFSLEATEKFDAAENAFKRIATIANGAYRPESDYHVARMELTRGKRDAASKKLTALLKELKKRETKELMDHAFVRKEAEARLRELGIDPDEIKIASEKEKKKETSSKSEGKSK